MAKQTNYFGVHFPFPYISTKSRFFFFKTLLDEKEGIPSGADLAQMVHGFIGAEIQSLIREDPESQSSIVINALNFLKQLADANKADEIAWLQKHLIDNPDIPISIRERAKTFFDTTKDSFDYIEFITYFNICLTGFEKYRANLEYETERLKELDSIWEELRKFQQNDAGKYYYLKSKAARNLKEKTGNDILKDEDLLAETFIQFAQRQLKEKPLEKSKYQKALGSQTLINKVASALDNVFTALWRDEDNRKKMANLLSDPEAKLEDLNQTELAYIVTQLAIQSAPLINQIIDQALYEASDNHVKQQTEDIINLFMKQLESDGSLTSQEKLSANFLESLVKRIKSIKTDSEQTEILNRRLFTQLKIKGRDLTEEEEARNKMIKKTGSKEKLRRGGITGLTEEMINSIMPAIQQLQVASRRHSFGRKRNGNEATERSIIIDKLRTILQVGLANSEENKKYGVKPKGKNAHITYEEIAKLARRIYKNSPDVIKTKISGRSNILSEVQADQTLINSINPDGLINQITPTNLSQSSKKADVTTIELGKVEITPAIQDKFSELAKEIVNMAMTSPHGLKDENIQYSGKAIGDAKTARKKAGFTATEFYLKGETSMRLDAWKTAIKDLTTQAKSNTELAEVARQALKSLENSFKISTSVKSYDKYNNARGFSGGSLGGSLEHQIENIEEMFQQGNLTFPDKDWLLFAIYNAGNALVGADYKADLEHFLSIFAVALMFDDAGEQAHYIANASKQFEVTPHFLHLFLFNGTYFPSSYLLYKTYEELRRLYGLIENFSSIKMSSGITIINPVSYNDADIERSGSAMGKTTTTKQWYSTFKKNQRKVTLQVTLLAGLLDILDELNNFNLKP